MQGDRWKGMCIMWPSAGEDCKWHRDCHFAGWMGSHFLLGEIITKKATLTQIFGDFFFLWKQVVRFCLFSVVCWGEYVARGLSAGYTLNDPVQKCCQLSWNLSGEARQCCYNTKLEKKTPVGIHFATFLLNTDNKEWNWKDIKANLKCESSYLHIQAPFTQGVKANVEPKLSNPSRDMTEISPNGFTLWVKAKLKYNILIHNCSAPWLPHRQPTN